MATKAVTLVKSKAFNEDTITATWEAHAGTDDGTPVKLAGYGDRSIQVEGNFDSGTIILQGKNTENAVWATLKDPFNNDISFTAAGIKQVVEVAKYMRTVVSGGGGSCAIIPTMTMRK